MRRGIIVVAGLLLTSLSSVSLGLDPLGPPKALLGAHHWSLGVEYAYSETDIKLYNIILGRDSPADFTSRAMKANRVYAALGYGLLNNVDVFGRLGGVALEAENQYMEFDGNLGSAWGVGVAATLYEGDRLGWGMLGQWSQGQSREYATSIWSSKSRTQARVDSFQLATGPTYQIKDDMWTYGGVFYHALAGKCRVGDALPQFDFKEDNSFGGFAGIRWELKENTYWNIELQHTGTAFAIATGLRWLFQ